MAYDPNNPLAGVIPNLPEANPANSAVVGSLNSGNSYASTLTQQANQQPSGLSGDNFNASYTKPDGTVVQGYNNSALPGQKPLGGGQQNDMAQTNSYLNALNTYADMRKTGIEMEKGPQAAGGSLPGLNQVGTSTATTATKAPEMASSWRSANGNLVDAPKPQSQQNPMMAMMGMMKQFSGSNQPPKPALSSSMRDVNGNLV